MVLHNKPRGKRVVILRGHFDTSSVFELQFKYIDLMFLSNLMGTANQTIAHKHPFLDCVFSHDNTLVAPLLHPLSHPDCTHYCTTRGAITSFFFGVPAPHEFRVRS